jgi:hypothetical protein
LFGNCLGISWEFERGFEGGFERGMGKKIKKI